MPNGLLHTLGRIDVTFAVQTMARFTAVPKAGHMQRMLRVFGYLKGYLKYGILADSTERVIAEVQELMREQKRNFPRICHLLKARK